MAFAVLFQFAYPAPPLWKLASEILLICREQLLKKPGFCLKELLGWIQLDFFLLNKWVLCLDGNKPLESAKQLARWSLYQVRSVERGPVLAERKCMWHHTLAHTCCLAWDPGSHKLLTKSIRGQVGRSEYRQHIRWTLIGMELRDCQLKQQFLLTSFGKTHTMNLIRKKLKE